MTTIALIGDHKIFSDFLSGLMNDFEGFRIAWCTQDGKNATRHLQQDETMPDIVLLDVVMPGMNGLEVG